MGWHIFPCRHAQRCRYHQRRQNATRRGIAPRLVDTVPAAIAVACAASISTVDVDVDEARGINGWDSIEEFPPFPDTVRQDTPRGGAHFFFRSDTPPRNRNSFRPGIDIRSDGYYVMLPPSLHPNGKPYKWTEGFAPGETGLAEFPDFMRPPREPLPWEKRAEAQHPARHRATCAHRRRRRPARHGYPQCDVLGCSIWDKVALLKPRRPAELSHPALPVPATGRLPGIQSLPSHVLFVNLGRERQRRCVWQGGSG